MTWAMTPQQRAAFGAPAFEAIQTLQAPHWGIRTARRCWSAALSVNVGLE